MYCANCGKQFDDQASFCPACGAAAKQPQQTEAPSTTINTPLKESKWDGGVLETLGTSLVASLLITITCGFGTAWAICFVMKFVLGHTLIDGKRLRFEGKGGSLFGKVIVWSLLSIITCGIYSFWVYPRLYRWIAEHITTEG